MEHFSLLLQIPQMIKKIIEIIKKNGGNKMRKIKFGIIGLLFILMSTNVVLACTGFTAYDGNNVLVGINEDNRSTRRYIEVYPPEEGKFGKILSKRLR